MTGFHAAREVPAASPGGGRICLALAAGLLALIATEISVPREALSAGPAGPALQTQLPAQSAGPGLDSLVAEALRRSPRIRALDAAHRASRERAPQAGALPDPVLTLEADQTPLGKLDPSQAMMKRYGFSQALPFPGKLRLGRAVMAEEAEAARYAVARGRLEVVAELRRSFYDLSLLYDSLDILEENRELVRAFAEIARTKYQVGRGELADVLKANVELAQVSNHIVVLQERVPAVAAALNAILDRPPGGALGRPVLPDTAGTLPDLTALEPEALAIQPMLRMSDQEVKRGERALALARKTGLPDFEVGFEYLSLRDADDAWAGMLGMTLPIWRGNKVGPARREAEETLASARAERERVENQVLFEVREAASRVAATKSLVELYRGSVLPQAELALASARASYETDKASFLDLLDAQRSLLGFRLEYREALAEHLKSWTELGLAVGDPAMLGADHE